MKLSASLFLASVPSIVNAITFQVHEVADAKHPSVYLCAHPIALNMIGFDAIPAVEYLSICRSQQSRFVLNSYGSSGAEMTINGTAVGIKAYQGFNFLCLRGKDTTCNSEMFYIDNLNRLRLSNGHCVFNVYAAMASDDCASKEGSLVIQIPKQFRVRGQVTTSNGARITACATNQLAYIGYQSSAASCDSDASIFTLIGDSLFMDSLIIGTKSSSTATILCPARLDSYCIEKRFEIDGQNKLRLKSNGKCVVNDGNGLYVGDCTGDAVSELVITQ